jgi:hypothetical protein
MSPGSLPTILWARGPKSRNLDSIRRHASLNKELAH